MIPEERPALIITPHVCLWTIPWLPRHHVLTNQYLGKEKLVMTLVKDGKADFIQGVATGMGF